MQRRLLEAVRSWSPLLALALAGCASIERLDQQIEAETDDRKSTELRLARAKACLPSSDLLMLSSALTDLEWVDKYAERDASNLGAGGAAEAAAVRTRLDARFEAELNRPEASESSVSSIFNGIAKKYRALEQRFDGKPEQARYAALASRAKALGEESHARESATLERLKEQRASMPSEAQRKSEREARERKFEAARAEGVETYGACPYCNGNGYILIVPHHVPGQNSPHYLERAKIGQKRDCSYCQGQGFKGPDYSVIPRGH
jgi:hypothetical protein